RVARDHDLAPAARLAHDLLGADTVHGLAALEPAELGSRRQTQGAGLLGVEVAGALVLNEGVALRPHSVVALEGGYPVAVAPQLPVRPDLVQAQLEGRPADDWPEPGKQSLEAGRPVHGQGALAAPEAEGLEQPGQPQHVVGVKV